METENVSKVFHVYYKILEQQLSTNYCLKIVGYCLISNENDSLEMRAGLLVNACFSFPHSDKTLFYSFKSIKIQSIQTPLPPKKKIK